MLGRYRKVGKKTQKGEKGELTRAGVDRMRNRKRAMNDKSVKEEHDTEM